MIINSMKLKTKNNPNIFVVETDEGDFELHSDIIVKNKIVKGVINDNIFYESVQQSSEIIAFNLATKYISSRLKTEQQIKDYLYKKGYHANTVNPVIQKLKDYSIIDDKMYASSYIKANPNFSKNKLKAKLSQFGIKNDIYEDLLQEIDDFDACFSSAKKFLKNKDVDKQTIEKLSRRLASQGYNWSTIKSVLNKFLEQD